MNRWVWITTSVVFFGLIYLTKGILLPFLAGLAIAYFLDPAADKLEERSIPRGIAASIVLTLFFMIMSGVVLAFWPILKSQLAMASAVLPKTIDNLLPWVDGMLASIHDQFGLKFDGNAASMIAGVSDEVLARANDIASSALRNGLAIFNILTLILISPVVAFYLLRDWDHMVAKANDWLPPEAAPAIRKVMTEMDLVLAGFVRGQLIVSLIMGILYGVGWYMVGLNFAVVLGVLAGILAFVPFVGALFAAFVATIVAIGQWGFDGGNIGMVLLVFVVVQVLEAAIFTPKLVGDKVRLHPVWVLFAIFAGSEVLGFVGVLIAVPMAAAIAVLVRHLIGKYLEHYDLDKTDVSDIETA